MKTNIIKRIIAAALILSTLLSFCSCGTSGKLKKGVSLTFTGPEGHATAHLELDREALDKGINAKKVCKKLAKAMMYDSDDIAEFKKYVKTLDAETVLDMIAAEYGDTAFELFYDIELENNTELSNGDEVIIRFAPSSFIDDTYPTLKKVNKLTGCSVPEEMKIKVEGLEAAKDINIFANVGDIVEFSGANGHGTAAINIPDDFEYQGDGYKITKYYDSSLLLTIDEGHEYRIGLDVDESTTLRPGEKVTVSMDESDAESINSSLQSAGFVLKAASAEVSVPDLGQATEFDILAKAKDYVVFYGANGKGTAGINIPDDTEFKIGNIYFSKREYYNNALNVIYDNKELGSISFTVDDGGTLTQGDKVILKIEGKTVLAALQEADIYPKAETMEITVPDLGNYINSADELTADDIKYLKKYALDQAAKNIDTPITFYAVYFGKIKDGSAHKYNGKGVVKVVYYYEQTFIISTTTVGKSFDYYDLCKDSQGNIRFGHTETTGCQSSDTLVEDFDQNYTYEKLG